MNEKEMWFQAYCAALTGMLACEKLKFSHHKEWDDDECKYHIEGISHYDRECVIRTADQAMEDFHKKFPLGNPYRD